MKKVRAALVFVILLLTVYIGSQGIPGSGQQSAAPGKNTSDQSPATETSPSVSTKATNPGTGIPSSPEPAWASLRENMSWDSSGLAFVTHPDGSQSVRGGGQFTQMAASVRNASGELVIQCFTDYTAMDDALSGRTVPLPAPSASDEIDYEISDF
ncbi:MAG: hypothetical protein AB3N33_11950 [Puniceicoccaceae bacterium]